MKGWWYDVHSMNQEPHAKRDRELKWETPQQSGCNSSVALGHGTTWCAFIWPCQAIPALVARFFVLFFGSSPWIQNSERSKHKYKLYKALCQRRKVLVQCDISIKWTWKHNLAASAEPPQLKLYNFPCKVKS